ncbi:MAG TPA: GWxTD domain-containing protein [Bryobacteraceae bacterium]|jgi:GWxTD domain-containing protein|nr:GWxTD domain-containing protein [Bryobacteraceae bacterium]
MRQVFVYITLGTVLSAQNPPAPTQPPQSSSSSKETIAKPKTDKQKKKDEAKLKKELETPYKRWLNEEVGYIITDEERKVFKTLQTDDERQTFIENFWLRRDPTPDTEENEYREEHYRRIAYANDRYASGIPGWKTDRGRIYIEYGPPDEIDSHPSGGTYERPYEEGGGSTSTYPFEQWRYRYIEGIGTNIILEFVDTTMSGEYHLTMDPSEKDALLYVPGAGLTMAEQMGLSDKTARFTRTDGTHLGTGSMPLPESMNEFSRIEQYAKIFRPPAIKYKDLEAVVSSSIKYNLLPMKVLVDYIPLTASSVLTQITIQFDTKDMQFKDKDNLSTATINIYGRISTLARRPLAPFEDVVSVPEPTEMLQKMLEANPHQIYQKTIPLQPGLYRLNIAAKDLVGGNTGTYELKLDVPRMDDDVLSASSIILADTIEKLPTKNIGNVPFAIGGSKVRPRIGLTDSTVPAFSRREKLGIYMQLYNFESDETTHKPDGQIDYEIVKVGTNPLQKVFEYSEEVKDLQGGSAQKVIEYRLPLSDLEPGEYKLTIKATDKIRAGSQPVTKSASFTVN